MKAPTKRLTQRENREQELYWAAINKLAIPVPRTITGFVDANAVYTDQVRLTYAIPLLAHMFDKPESDITSDIMSHRRMFETLGLTK